MTTSAQAKPVWDGFILPDDLSVYIGTKTLVKRILDAIEWLNARTAGCETVATGNPDFQPAMMLTLLTYCYATCVYGSTDIELNMQHDRMIRYLCAKNYINLPVLREFRRYSRHRIKACLATVLPRGWELRACDEGACATVAAPRLGVRFGRSL